MTKINKLALAPLALAMLAPFTACQKNEPMIPSASSAQATVHSTERISPDVPAILEVPAGNSVSYHVYATGFQVYTCTETAPGTFAWVLTAPDAVLYGNAGFNGGGVGTHFGGPTWKSNSGSYVIGAKLQGATVDVTAVPWLLLAATTSQGPGPFDGTTYIQRVNTTGGLAPSTGANASTVGQQTKIPYTAEYYFYKAD